METRLPRVPADDSQVHLALVSLALASLPNTTDAEELQAASPSFRPLSPDAAFAILATEVGSGRIPRLVVLDALVRFKARTSSSVATGAISDDVAPPPPSPELTDLLGVLGRLGPQPGPEPTGDGIAGPADTPPSAAVILQTSLDAVAGELDLSQAWQTFASSAGPVLCEAEAGKPPCDCANVTVVKNVTRRTVVSKFRTKVLLSEIKTYADPHNWPRCSTYFKSMVDVAPGMTAVSNGWDGVIEETVEIIPPHLFVTPLKFKYRETLDANGNLVKVRLDYDLANAGGTADIAVDKGWIEMSTDSNPLNPMPTGVEAIKTIGFKNPLWQSWTSLLCDTAWGELVIDAAMRCANCDQIAIV